MKFIAYVTCGDGDTVRIVEELEQAGADMIELGIPFSDPIADGPVIQAASQRAEDARRLRHRPQDPRAERDSADCVFVSQSGHTPWDRELCTRCSGCRH